MKKNIGLYIITCCISFTVLVLVHAVGQTFDMGLAIDAQSILQMFAVTACIAFLMWITDRFFPSYLNLWQVLSQIGCVLVTVLLLGGLGFKWFPFTWQVVLPILGITVLIYLAVLGVLEIRARTDSDYINKAIQEKKNSAGKEKQNHG